MVSQITAGRKEDTVAARHFNSTGAQVDDAPSYFFSFFCSRGLPFISHLDSLPNFTRSSDGPVRLPIVDKYKVSNQRRVVLRLSRGRDRKCVTACLLHRTVLSQQICGRHFFFLSGFCLLCQNLLCSLFNLLFPFLLDYFSVIAPTCLHTHTEHTHCKSL